MAIDVQATGAFPAPGSLIVANHLGFLDIIVLAAVMDTAFVAKHEVATWPWIGGLAKRAGTLFIRRGHFRDVLHVKDQMRDALDRGQRVTYFPEGTTTNGERVLPFRSGLLQAALDGRHPVHCASIRLSTAGLADSALCWWGEETLISALHRVLGVRRITARLHFDAAMLPGVPRKPLARALHALVETRVAILREEQILVTHTASPRQRRRKYAVDRIHGAGEVHIERV
jgi:1-acyl-sn-glycerol-3-phosphate acyltransferase